MGSTCFFAKKECLQVQTGFLNVKLVCATYFDFLYDQAMTNTYGWHMLMENKQQPTKALRSIDYSWKIARARGEEFPAESRPKLFQQKQVQPCFTFIHFPLWGYQAYILGAGGKETTQSRSCATP